jgi:hypothetical protein
MLAFYAPRYADSAKMTIRLVIGAVAVAVAAGAPGATAADTRACAPTEVRQLVVRFIAAFNAGDMARLDAIFAKEPGFQWYSTGKPGDRRDPMSRNRATLIPYFARRHRQHERLTLVSWAGGGNANGFAHYQFHVVRRAKDAPRPLRLEGKGAAICSASGDTIAVWAM